MFDVTLTEVAAMGICKVDKFADEGRTSGLSACCANSASIRTEAGGGERALRKNKTVGQTMTHNIVLLSLSLPNTIVVLRAHPISQS